MHGHAFEGDRRRESTDLVVTLPVQLGTDCVRPLGARRELKNLRWIFAGLLALATALSYFDRQSFPIVAGEIRKEIPLSTEEYGYITSLFLLAYAIMYAVGGRIIDLLGTRAGYALMILWWSAANFLTGTVSSVFTLGTSRFLLGMGEGGGFPGSAKAVAEWFPARERSTAFGVFNFGSSIGAIAAPPLVVLIVSTLGWRWVFFITGSLGFIWGLVWLKVYQPPATNRFVSADELAHIQDVPAAGPPACTKISWIALFGYREVWGMMAAKFISDAAWYFYIFWLPKYLSDVRHLDIKGIGYFAWIPFAAAGAGSLIGGWLGAELIRRGVSLDLSRKIVLAIGASLMPVSLFIAAAPFSLVIVFFSLAMFAHQFWSANIQTLPADLFPTNAIGSVGGLLGSAGSFGGMLFGLIVGWLAANYGYGPVFVMAGIFHPIAFVVILTVVRRIQPMHVIAPRTEICARSYF